MAPTKVDVERGRDPLLVWGANGIEPNTIEQAKMTARLPFVRGPVALMPDAHVGFGSTVGSVFATRGAIVPSAIGVDIGCGMAAYRLESLGKPLTSFDLTDTQNIHRAIRKVVPAGVGQGHKRAQDAVFLAALDHDARRPALLDERQKLTARARQQFGTLGAGNHFVEVCLDEQDRVWVVLHSGSRGVGNELAKIHIDGAKGLMKEYFIELENDDLAYLPEGTPAFDAYINDMRWAQAYAAANRQQMLDAIHRALEGHFERTINQADVVNCHHNFTQLEHVRGENVWVTRKGAISARATQLGIIPGSMATGTYIVQGLGNEASLQSCSHGAGRKLSRNQAKRELSEETLRECMSVKVGAGGALVERAWNGHDARQLVDEHPDAYKDIEDVMNAQSDLVEVVHTLTQAVNYKGTK